ncbi:hypothetical protein V9W64_10845 [Neisseria leonii]|uniref:Uncharacterized protein n=1 Tax=Neisseria leonii TaxID=2995413 RepID=A0A9X4I9V8_9NEIS|nr:hypothetical protein [Neisseria sp. 51.81]MDD9326739.1 hypothetical protein [Neisseria sp. 51.81]
MAQVNLGIQLDVNTRNIQGWALGTEAERITDKDLHKAVVLDTTQEGTLKLAADGDEIRGFIESVEPAPTDKGTTFGSVVRHAPGVRVWAAGSGLNKGDKVVAGAQTAAGTANATANPRVDRFGVTQVKSGSPTTFVWEVVRVEGDLVLIEAV